MTYCVAIKTNKGLVFASDSLTNAGIDHVALRHTTVYRFDRTINLGPHIVRLRPAPHSRTPIVAYSLKITHENHFINWQQDPFGNYLARLVFPDKTCELSIDVEVIAAMTVINPLDRCQQAPVPAAASQHCLSKSAGCTGFPADSSAAMY